VLANIAQHSAEVHVSVYKVPEDAGERLEKNFVFTDFYM